MKCQFAPAPVRYSQFQFSSSLLQTQQRFYRHNKYLNVERSMTPVQFEPLAAVAHDSACRPTLQHLSSHSAQAFRGTPAFPGTQFKLYSPRTFHSTENKPFLSRTLAAVKRTFRVEQNTSDVLTAICWVITHLYLHLQIGLHLQYSPVFTALYPIRPDSSTRHLFINRRFRISNHQ